MTEIIQKRAADLARPPNLPDYDAFRRTFSWEAARAALDGLPGGRGLNIAHEAVDRHAAGARARPGRDPLARPGRHATRPHLRRPRAGVQPLRERAARPRRRRRRPRLRAHRPHPGALLRRARRVEEPKACLCTLFSAFGPEPIRARMAIGEARVLVTTEALYRKKIAGIRAALPKLEHVLVVGERTALADTRDLAPLMAAAADTLRDPAHRPGGHGAPALHERHHRHAERRGARARRRGRAPHDRRSSRSICTPTTCSGAPPTRAG